MAQKALEAADAPVLKIKLDADRPFERLAAIREQSGECLWLELEENRMKDTG